MADPPSRGATSEEINRLIHQHAKPGAKIHLEDVRGHRAVAVGLALKVGVVIDGEAGDFLAAFNAGGLVGARGSVGHYAAYGMTAGSLRITGRAGDGTAAFLQGGSVRGFSDVGTGAGWGMRGGDLTVLGDAGELVGASMVGGEIAVLGRANGPVGIAMSGGTIFVRSGTAVDPSCCKVSPLDAVSAARLVQLATGVNVPDLDTGPYARVTGTVSRAPAGGAAESPPTRPSVRVASQPAVANAPRVRVSVSPEDEKGVDLQ
jgi:hypothetical protein